MPNDAYIWQRVWHPALLEAITQSAPQVRQWHVLAGEADRRSQLQASNPNWQALRASQRPIVMVVRLDGQLVDLDTDALLQQIVALHARWQTQLNVAGIEIDHDCASSRLPQYAAFLTKLHAALGQPIPLSITALPAWLNSPALDTVLAQADDVTLQVHAVQNPEKGLFDPVQAMAWLHAMAQHGHGFRVALPAYGSRVDFDTVGEPLGVRSEAPTANAGVMAQELIVPPQQVANFIADLKRRPVPYLQGIVWFRLPTRDDRRAWSVSTWLAVLRGMPLTTQLMVQGEPTDDPALFNVVLRNTGDIDAVLPSGVDADAACHVGDALGGYQLVTTPSVLRFSRHQMGLLHPGQRVMIGWLRCTVPPSRWQVVSE